MRALVVIAAGENMPIITSNSKQTPMAADRHRNRFSECNESSHADWSLRVNTDNQEGVKEQLIRMIEDGF